MICIYEHGISFGSYAFLLFLVDGNVALRGRQDTETRKINIFISASVTKHKNLSNYTR